MSEVKVAYGEKPDETAVLLLAAAEELDLDAGVVRTTSDAVFLVPEPVAEAADLEYEAEDDEDADEAEPEVLKGEALDAALEERGLSKSGTADEKRARVAEYDANQE